MAEPRKILCDDCGWRGTENDADHVQDPGGDDIWTVCPKCRAPEQMKTICDEPGCINKATCGTPVLGGYRTTCFDHRPTPAASLPETPEAT